VTRPIFEEAKRIGTWEGTEPITTTSVLLQGPLMMMVVVGEERIGMVEPTDDHYDVSITISIGVFAK